MDSIIQETSKLSAKKDKVYKALNHYLNSLEDIISSTITQLSTEKKTDKGKASEKLTEISKLKISEMTDKITNCYKNSCKKLGEKIDAVFDNKQFLDQVNLEKFENQMRENEFVYEELIIDDLIRKGKFDSAAAIMSESKLISDETKKRKEKDLTKYKEFYNVLKSLDNNGIEGVYDLLKWCEEKEEDIRKYMEEGGLTSDKNIFYLSKKILYLIKFNDRNKSDKDLLLYARLIFGSFFNVKNKENSRFLFKKDIEKMVGLILRKEELTHLDLSSFFREIKQLFVEVFLGINGLTKETNLDTILLAGHCVLPQILSSDASSDSDVNFDKEKNQLLSSTTIPEELVFHSLCLCPVLKEVISKENPLIRLKCGHCVSKKAFDFLEKKRQNKIKCPICNQTQEEDEFVSLEIF